MNTDTGNTISPTELADSRGISRQAVMKWIDNGSFQGIATKVGSRWRIDKDAANLLMNGTATPEGERVAKDGKFPLQGVSKEKTEYYVALLKELEYKRAAGELVPIKEVHRSLFALMQPIAAACLAIPARVTPDIMSADTAHEVSQIIEEEIHIVLKRLSTVEEWEFLEDRKAKKK